MPPSRCLLAAPDQTQPLVHLLLGTTRVRFTSTALQDLEQMSSDPYANSLELSSIANTEPVAKSELSLQNSRTQLNVNPSDHQSDAPAAASELELKVQFGNMDASKGPTPNIFSSPFASRPPKPLQRARSSHGVRLSHW